MKADHLLKNTFPELQNEWNYTKNKDKFNFNELTYGSQLKVWWVCRKGHEWEATIKNRTKGRGCPYCAGKKASKENSLETLYPNIAKEWHPTRNNGLTPSQVTSGTNKRFWWLCEKGHEWETSVNNRTSGTQCPECNDSSFGKRSWFKNSPDLLIEWHPEKNGVLEPEDISLGYRNPIWWLCQICGFEWEANLNSRYHGNFKCIQCRSLLFNNPRLVKEWHPEKNGEITPNKVSAFSNQMVWWKCNKCKEEWQDRVCDRQKDGWRGCPFCAGKRVGKSNSLQSKYPNLAKEWGFEKNGKKTPETIYFATTTKVWWKCDRGHEWEESVRVRVAGSKNLEVLGCPFCSGHRVSDDNCLGNVNPELAKEWHPTKNKLTPRNVTPGSSESVWWICSKGHEWLAPVTRRSQGKGCPRCNLQTSFPEQVIFYYLNKVFPNVENRFVSEKLTEGNEIDVFLKDYKIGIEYDGYFYHKDKKDTDERKSISLARKEILLIRVREDGLPVLENVGDLIFSYKSGDVKTLEKIIETIIDFIQSKNNIFDKKDTKIKIKEDREEIIKSYYFLQEKESIYYTNPEAMELWDFEKNTLSPTNLRSGTDIKVWWLCQKGHSWMASVNKVIKGQRCPLCKNKRVTIGNSLAEKYPEIAKEWHPTKNDDITPSEVVFGSGKRVWWQCINGHEWINSVTNRTKRGQSCAFCSGKGRKVLSISDVKEIFRKENCILLEDEYVNSITKMKYRCSCGNVSFIALSKFKSGKRCRSCGVVRARTKRITQIEDIKLLFEKEGCKLLEIEYKSGNKLRYICSCGNESYITLYKFKQGQRCKSCREERIKKTKSRRK